MSDDVERLLANRSEEDRDALVAVVQSHVSQLLALTTRVQNLERQLRDTSIRAPVAYTMMLETALTAMGQEHVIAAAKAGAELLLDNG